MDKSVDKQETKVKVTFGRLMKPKEAELTSDLVEHIKRLFAAFPTGFVRSIEISDQTALEEDSIRIVITVDLRKLERGADRKQVLIFDFGEEQFLVDDPSPGSRCEIGSDFSRYEEVGFQHPKSSELSLLIKKEIIRFYLSEWLLEVFGGLLEIEENCELIYSLGSIKPDNEEIKTLVLKSLGAQESNGIAESAVRYSKED